MSAFYDRYLRGYWALTPRALSESAKESKNQAPKTLSV
jgi:hypothetical protein